MSKSFGFVIWVSLLAVVAPAGCSSDDTGAGVDAAVDADESSFDAPADTMWSFDTGPADVKAADAKPDVTLDPCSPGAVGSLPAWVPPAPENPTACTTQQLTTFADNCFGQNSSACGQFVQGSANAACVGCLLTYDTAPAWGAYSYDTGLANIGGCIALRLGDTSATGCGASYAKAEACNKAACDNNCKGSTATKLQSCYQAAASGVCASSNNAFQTACSVDGGAQAQTDCGVGSTTNLQWVLDIGGTFCGSYGCTPQCTGKNCGGDGCGGWCGSCSGSEVCNAGVCCAPQCMGKTCGADGCGGTCGTCSGNDVCDGSGHCVCVPQCTGKFCGPDGCGGSCGTCGSGDVCNTSGQCVCAPQCTGKTCGPDGCGGSCGTCASHYTCDVDTCVCAPDCTGLQCGGDGCGGSCGTCATGKTCSGGACVTCTPQCSGKTCGPDGCGGSCGTCGTGQSCGGSGTCCGAVNSSCSQSGQCCSNLCYVGTNECVSCLPSTTLAFCSNDNQCCSGLCDYNGYCVNNCKNNLSQCTDNTQCCSNKCTNGTCMP